MPSTATAKSTTPRMCLRSLYFLLLLAPAMAASSCSCTPTKYTFRLALSQDCSTNDIADNDGIRESLCFIEEGVTLPRSSEKRDIVGGPFRGRIRSPADVAAFDDAADGSGGEQVRRMGRSNRRSLSAAPVEVISIQYLEFYASNTLNVTYTDDRYLSSSLVDGDAFEFYSQSSLPSNDETVGGASLILYGKNEDGELIRNRFFWTFEDCEGALNAVPSGDAIGWVTIDEVAGPFPMNCPAVPADSPTISPRTDQPTFEPTGSTKFTEGPTTVNWVTPSPSGNNGGDNGGPTPKTVGPTPANWVTPSPSSTDGEGNGGSTPTTKGPTPANWATPSPSSGNGVGTEDESGTATDDSAGEPDDNDTGSEDSNGNIFDSTSAPTAYYGPSYDVAPAPSPKGTKSGKTFVEAKSSGNAHPNGKTPKHPYDTWGNSYDGGEIPGKSGKSSKGGKTHGKTTKGYDAYSNIDDSLDEDDDYPPYSQRLFTKASRDGESIRQ